MKRGTTLFGQFLGADGDVFEMTKTYIRVILLFAPAFLTNDILLCFVRNDGSPGLSMCGMLVGSMANIVLDYFSAAYGNTGCGAGDRHCHDCL